MDWIKKGDVALVLAPMEGVTDFPMRSLMTERCGFKLCVAEFLRVNQTVIPDFVFYRHIPELENGGRTLSGTPVMVQILGGDPDRMAETAIRAVELGAQGIDINFGCPAPTVNRHDGGAVLLKCPERLEKIVAAVRSRVAATIPVSAKIRLGWENVDDVFPNAQAIANAGASWLTIHARTRNQGYAPPVRWDLVGRVREMLSIPVVANGDINTFAGFQDCRRQTGCEHFMLGRGALGDPALVGAILSDLSQNGSPAEEPFGHDRARWATLLRRFVEINQMAPKHPDRTTHRIKQWLNMASRIHPIRWFEDLKHARSNDEIWRILDVRE